MSEQTHRAVVPTWQAVLNLILLTAAFICSLLCLRTPESASVYGTLKTLFNIIAVLSGAYYCFSGYKKNGRLFFKMFAYSYALSHIFVIMYLAEMGASPALAAVTMISFGAVCILATGLDLGKERSYLAAAVVLFCQLVGLILFLIYPETSGQAPLGPVAKSLIAVLLFFIVYAKYRDKEHRHTT